jgi:hypothetical protein
MSHVIVGENRVIVMPDDESIEFTRARRAIAHPRAQIQAVMTAWHPEIGIHGALEVCVRAHLHGCGRLTYAGSSVCHPSVACLYHHHFPAAIKRGTRRITSKW